MALLLDALGRTRLEQETWHGEKGALRLAQLLQTITGPDIPITTNVPITIRAPEGVAPININNYTPGAPIFNFTDQYGNPVTPEVPDPFNPGPGGGGGGGTSVFIAEIVSGSGNAYTLRILPSGVGNPGQLVDGTLLPAGASDTIPVGTQVTAIRASNDVYYFFFQGVFPCEIVSGSGDAYVITVYPHQFGSGGFNVNATQLQIDASETIPAGTRTLATRTTSGAYYIQVPVWLSS